eukprot:CAMPEP_0114573374 /NCGR_PEP_ID=MMETSP0114-20121206/18832_1 /TAXON_ID=31324 /ORGANISM="Goniomonas sp, Strain m" /LENGTH=488 /DNA_ID=CAMNT_0001760729 /DNA_START=589 /DNA_END=2056 /DNA_ORIENTATION=-
MQAQRVWRPERNLVGDKFGCDGAPLLGLHLKGLANVAKHGVLLENAARPSMQHNPSTIATADVVAKERRCGVPFEAHTSSSIVNESVAFKRAPPAGPNHQAVSKRFSNDVLAEDRNAARANVDINQRVVGDFISFKTPGTVVVDHHTTVPPDGYQVATDMLDSMIVWVGLCELDCVSLCVSGQRSKQQAPHQVATDTRVGTAAHAHVGLRVANDFVAMDCPGGKRVHRHAIGLAVMDDVQFEIVGVRVGLNRNAIAVVAEDVIPLKQPCTVVRYLYTVAKVIEHHILAHNRRAFPRHNKPAALALGHLVALEQAQPEVGHLNTISPAACDDIVYNNRVATILHHHSGILNHLKQISLSEEIAMHLRVTTTPDLDCSQQVATQFIAVKSAFSIITDEDTGTSIIHDNVLGEHRVGQALDVHSTAACVVVHFVVLEHPVTSIRNADAEARVVGDNVIAKHWVSLECHRDSSGTAVRDVVAREGPLRRMHG